MPVAGKPHGIGAGFVGYAGVKVLRGRGREVHPMMFIAAAAFLVYFAITGVRRVLGVG
ncbi:MAG: hypothetical protein ACRDJ4_00205 [Actinomycetota bacterium]